MRINRKRPSGCGHARPSGVLLILLGTLLIIWVVPARFWAALLGVLLVTAGLLLYKYG